MLLPKEHGAYGQVAFPLATAFAVAGVSTAGALVAAAVIAGFLAHEPAAVALGLRGVRAKRDTGQEATRSVWMYGGIGIAAFGAAATLIAPQQRWSLVVPVVPAALLAVAMVRGREKTWLGETLAALAFSATAVPVAIAGGAAADAAWTVAIPFALLFVTTTLAVRVVILRVRGGGNAAATAATRRATIAVSICALIAMSAMAAAGWLAASLLAATAPGLLTAALVAARPPEARHLRALGWTLVAISTLTAAIVVATA